MQGFAIQEMKSMGVLTDNAGGYIIPTLIDSELYNQFGYESVARKECDYRETMSPYFNLGGLAQNQPRVCR